MKVELLERKGILMKRTICCLLALLLCAALCFNALAEATLAYEIRNLEVNMIDGSDYLRIRGDAGYYLAKMDGTQLSAADYSYQMHYDDGLFVTVKANGDGLNAWGALDETGAEVIPFQYGNIKVLSPEWAVCVTLTPAESEEEYDFFMMGSDVNCNIETVDIYSLKGPGLVTTLDRAHYSDSGVYGETLYVQDRGTGAISAYDIQGNVTETEYSSIYDPKYEATDLSYFDIDTGLRGLKDADGNVILEPTYGMIFDFDGGYAKVTAGDGEKYGLIDQTGALVIPTEYDDIEYAFSSDQPYEGEDRYENCGYFCVVKDGKIGFAKAGGEVTCALKYDMDAGGFFNQGISTVGNVDGRTIVLAADGVETEIPTDEYSYADAVMSCTQGRFYRVSSPDYDYGVIDWHGNEVLPCEYHSISPFGDGKHVLVSTETNDGKSYQVYELADPLEAE